MRSVAGDGRRAQANVGRTMSVWTIVVAAGRGDRFGGDKQVADLSGRPVLAHSVATAAVVSDGVVVVIAAEKTFKLLAKNPLGEKCFATPAVANGVMYQRTQTKLFSLGGKN